MSLCYCPSCGEWRDMDEVCIGCGAFEANGPVPDPLDEDYERAVDFGLGDPHEEPRATFPERA